MVTKRLHNPCGGHVSLDLVNSVGRSVGLLENERLTDYPALVRWCREAGVLGADTARSLTAAAGERPREARAVLERAIALREALFALWHADIHALPTPGEALDTLNAELAASLARSRLEPTGEGFRWTWCQREHPLDAPLWPIVREAADLLVSCDRDRVRECAADTCLWIFVDRSRNHRRRWCEMKGCGNREKVRSHRRRRKTDGA